MNDNPIVLLNQINGLTDTLEQHITKMYLDPCTLSTIFQPQTNKQGVFEYKHIWVKVFIKGVAQRTYYLYKQFKIHALSPKEYQVLVVCCDFNEQSELCFTHKMSREFKEIDVFSYKRYFYEVYPPNFFSYLDYDSD